MPLNFSLPCFTKESAKLRAPLPFSLHVLGSKDLNSYLKNQYISSEDLKSLFAGAGKTVPPKKAPLRKRKDFEDILREHESFYCEQQLLVHIK